jgi:site-specific recombinase XerD
MEYHKTKDLLHVKQLLGHKDLRTTLRYTQLIDFGTEEFHSATAKTVEEAAKLIEQGFDYVTEIDGIKLFRKRK